MGHDKETRRRKSDFAFASSTVLDTENSARLPSEASRKTASQNYAYTLQEILEILARLAEPAATVFAVASFAGLRRSELEGLEWPDFHDGHRWVARSIWNGEVLLPKTEMSACLLFQPLSQWRNGWSSIAYAQETSTTAGSSVIRRADI